MGGFGSPESEQSMRMRAKRHLPERLERCSAICVKAPEMVKGKWNQMFGNDNPLHLEIGCGKGSFVIQMAQRHPDINFVAMEKDRNVLITAMEQTMKLEIPNIRFIGDNADRLEEFFAEDECQRIYLNFSDPLPKSGYKKRRLTYDRYLVSYEKILVPGGEIHQKTDNTGLFEFSLNSFLNFGYKLKNISLDLHNSKFAEENVVTEYEAKFSSMGMPIYRLEAVNPKGNNKEAHEGAHKKIL